MGWKNINLKDGIYLTSFILSLFIAAVFNSPLLGFLIFIIIFTIVSIIEHQKIKKERKKIAAEEQERKEHESKTKEILMKQRIEQAVCDKKIKKGKTFEETKSNYEKCLEVRARERCMNILRSEDNRYCCNKCGYCWESRKKFGSPSICPACRGDYILKYYDTKEGKKELLNRCEDVENTLWEVGTKPRWKNYLQHVIEEDN